MRLYINTELDSTQSLVTSQIDNNQKILPTMHLGDAIPIVVSFTDNNGGFVYWQTDHSKNQLSRIGQVFPIEYPTWFSQKSIGAAA